MGWVRDLGRKAVSVAAAPMTGGLSLIGLNDGMYGKAKDFLLGQKPDDVNMPAGYDEARARQQAAIGALQAQVAAMDPTKMAADAERAAMQRGALQAQAAGAQQRSQAAGVRGYGALGAMRAASANSAAASVQIGANTSAQAAGDRLGALTAGQRMQLQGQGMILSAEQQMMQQALMEEEYRRQNARQGFLPTALGVLGTVAGGYFGGPQGAAAGGQLGTGVGQGVLAGYGY